MTHSRMPLCVFDLDGTLTDSSETIYITTIATLKQLSITPNFTKQQLDARIGEHFKDIFDAFTLDVGDIDEFIALYKIHYFRYLDKTYLYPGVLEMLQSLRAKGCAIALLTTKAQDQAEKILESFSLTDFFTLIMGRRPGMQHKPNPEPLTAIHTQLGYSAAETIMIGDTELDILCGKAAGTRTVAVAYGYRPRKHLLSFQPDYIAPTVSALEHYLLFSVK